MAGIRNLNITFQIDGGRSARNKLSSMGGIMSSSEELIQAAMPMIEKLVGDTKTPREEYMSTPAPVGMAIGGLVPLVAAGSRAVKPFLNTIKMGRNARPGMKNVTPPGGGPKPPPPGGASTPPPKGGSTALVPKKVDITEKAPAFMEKLKRFGVTGAAIAPLIAGIQAAILGNPSVENIEEETNTSIEDLNKQTDAVPPDVAKNMTKQELADEFMRVAKNTALADPGSYADRFGKAILLGLTTKMAAMGDGATGQKSRANYLYNAIKTATYNRMLDEGKSPAEALRIARDAAIKAAPNATDAQDVAALTGGGISVPTKEEFMKKAKEANPNVSDAELEKFYKNKYGQ